MALCERNNHLLAAGWKPLLSTMSVFSVAAFLVFYFISGDWVLSLIASGASAALLILADFINHKVRGYFSKKMAS